MPDTLQECLDEERKSLYGQLAELDEVQRTLAVLGGLDLLNVSVSCVAVWDCNRITLYISDHPDYRGTSCKVASAIGSDSVMKTFEGTYEDVNFQTDDLLIKIRRNIPRSRRKGCKQYRVVETKEITVCGAVDEDRYDSVELLSVEEE